MFGGEASDKFVKVLSGGERSRLAMIRLLLEPVNFLILDEPTNHLDMQSKDVLKQAISNFDGTAIIVSHDRDFLDGLVDKVYEFGGGKVREHIGGIYDFLQKKRIESLDELGRNMNSAGSPSAVVDNPARPTVADDTKASSTLSYAELKEQNRLIRKAEKAVETAEKKVADLEKEIAATEAKLATPEGSADTSLFTRYGELKAQLAAAEEEWTEASIALEEVKG